MAAKPSRAMWQGLALIGFPALIAVGLLAYGSTTVTPQLAENQRLVSHTLQVIAAARAFDLAVGDAESAARGFIITGDNGYIAAYKESTREITDRLERLHRLTLDNTEQQRRLTLIDSGTEGRISELQQAITARQNIGFLEARRIVQSHLGSDTRRVISGLVDVLVAQENGLLGQREAKLADSEEALAAVDRASIGLVSALLLFGIFLIVRAVLRESRSIAQLRESEERFRLLITGVRDYAIFMLDAEGRVASWNLGAERINGYRPAEIIGRHFSTFFTQEDRDAGVPAGELSRTATDGSLETEGWRVRKDGSRFYSHATLTALRDDKGDLRGFAKIVRDVTERRAQEKALEDSRSALAQAQKIESLGQLTGGIAHDFNNLLTVVIGSLDLVLRKRAEGKKAEELLDAAKQAAEQGAALVRRLLAFSRRQTLAPQSVDANRLVIGMAELVRRTLGDDVVLETVLGGNLWRTLADPSQLESALLNLAVNARDAMPNGGKLTIETGNTCLDKEYTAAHSDAMPGEYVMICVSDTGIGMSEETVVRAFEPFFTTKPEGRGTGLGLSQVHGFMRQSGGHISLESTAGKGTTVRMYLPRHTTEDVADSDVRPQTETPPAKGATILLVEDEPLVRMYSREVLEEQGYKVVEAADGKQALRVLAENPQIELLFTDLGLPGGLNGKHLAEEARARVPSLKVLYVTGYAKNAILNRDAFEAGTELLEKPYTVEMLAKKLKQLFPEAIA